MFGDLARRPLSEESLPADPSTWTRSHVSTWLKTSSNKYQLDDVFIDRFPMNGKGVLFMTKEMFLYRLPQGGGLLYEDLQMRVQKLWTEALKRAAT